jgi:hypothetical protein
MIAGLLTKCGIRIISSYLTKSHKVKFQELARLSPLPRDLGNRGKQKASPNWRLSIHDSKLTHF